MVVAKRLAQQGDRLGHHVVGGHGPRPHRLQQRLAANHVAGMFDQHRQHRHRLHGDPGLRAILAGDLAQRDVDHARADPQVVGWL